jgi:AcrR family transcriptional regulator
VSTASQRAAVSAAEGVRVRDPGRRDKILQAAAELVARRGYHAVSLADIGAAAGIVGSGVYRHFTGKSAILVALLDQVMDRLLENAARIVASGQDDALVLQALVADQVAFAVDDRYLVRLYQREVHTLPEADHRRLRRLQRHYVEEWVHVLAGVRPDLADGEVRAVVHAAIGAIQSVASHNSGLPPGQQQALLASIAHACLRAPVPAAPAGPQLSSMRRRSGRSPA